MSRKGLFLDPIQYINIYYTFKTLNNPLDKQPYKLDCGLSPIAGLLDDLKVEIKMN